jgi:caa(3)-type oxidase subunit IV
VSFSNAEEARKHRNTYLLVFAALAGLTIVTVAIAQVHFPTPLAVGLAMAVALTKGSLVACFFMHLISERKALYSILTLCVFFFAVLMALPSATEHTAVGEQTQSFIPAKPQASHH